jgi:deoxyinosine 3'endonuclease (endonuclease V)
MSNAQGLVIIVNDGNYTLEPEHFGFAAHQSLTTDYSSIHVASLVTVNMEAKKVDISTSLRLWMDYVRSNTDKIDPTFLLRLRTAWIQLYSSITGEPVPILNQSMVDLSSLKYKNK